MELQKAKHLKGEITMPGDKSISHRCIMFGSIAQGNTEITNFLQGEDCLSTIACFKKLGISIDNTNDGIFIQGKGLHGLTEPSATLDVGNSGTTIRLISGILSGQTFQTKLTGDDSIKKRPMNRIFDPLSKMGAKLVSDGENGCAPFTIYGKKLYGIHYQTPVASAQIKSCILLAGLYADGDTTVTEPAPSRDHTELMLEAFGAKLTRSNTSVTISPNPLLTGNKIDVPGDISSAAYFIAAGLITPNSEILIKNTGINPTRSGIITAAKAMGGTIKLLNERTVSGELVADILVKTSELHGTVIKGDIIPTLIDEIPVLAVMACFADGETKIEDAEELKVKESNRIHTVVMNLKNMGADIEGTEDGMIIKGQSPLSGCDIKTFADHRIAMAFSVAALNATGKTTLDDSSCVTISYPDFFNDIQSLQI